MKRLFLIALVILTSFSSVFAESREEDKLVIN
jgi:hypothetical protein